MSINIVIIEDGDLQRQQEGSQPRANSLISPKVTRRSRTLHPVHLSSLSDYLNQSMNYITYDNQSLTSYLDTEISVLDVANVLRRD